MWILFSSFSTQEPIPIPQDPSESFRHPEVSSHKRHWRSKDIEIRIRNPVDDAMTDGIVEMYEDIKDSPDPHLMRSVTRKMRALSQDVVSIEQVMQDELRKSVDTVQGRDTETRLKTMPLRVLRGRLIPGVMLGGDGCVVFKYILLMLCVNVLGSIQKN